MARPRKNEESVTRGINMPLVLVSQFELLEHDPMTGKVKYGAWTRLVEQALKEYLVARKAGYDSKEVARPKADMLRELKFLRNIALAVIEGDSTLSKHLDEYLSRYGYRITELRKEIANELEGAGQGG